MKFRFIKFLLLAHLYIHPWKNLETANFKKFMLVLPLSKNQYSRSCVSISPTAKIDQNKAQRLSNPILQIATCGFGGLATKYLANAIFGTSLAFQMSVLDRLENILFCN